MKNLISYIILLFICFLTINLQAQEDFKIKDASGRTLMEVREEGVLVTKLSTTERIAFASNLSTDDSGILVFDTDTQSFWVWKGAAWIEMDGIDLVDDADADASNEIQDLQLVGHTLTITQNGAATSIDLSPYLDNTDTQLTEVEVDAYTDNNGYLTTELDGDPTNEIELPAGGADGQVLSTDGSGNYAWIDSGAGVGGGTIQPFNNPNNFSIQAASDGLTAGNIRGFNSVDLQVNRGNATQIASGSTSVISGGNSNTASGSLSTVGGGYSNTASGSASLVAGGWENTSEGSFSTVVGGFENILSGSYSSIIGGHENTVSGSSANVIGGFFNSATGNYSNIIGGSSNTTYGRYSSIPGGRGLQALSYGEIVVGLYNELYTPDSETSFTAEDRLFVVGNGSNDSERSNAMTILKGGQVGIGISSPNEALEVDGTVSATAFLGDGSGLSGIETGGTVQGRGSNSYSLQIIDEGTVSGNTRGEFSVDLQSSRTNTTEVASGNYAVLAGGLENTASGQYSAVGGGEENVASEVWSTVGGGVENTASESFCTVAGGYNNTASGSSAVVAGGQNNAAIAFRSAILGGYNNTASGNYGNILGGRDLNALSYGESVVGLYNEDYTPNSTTTINANDRLFVVGNGTSTTNRSNALTILKNGNTGIGVSIPTAELQVGQSGDGSVGLANAWNTFSDRRLKKNIIPIDSPIEKLHALNGYYYHWVDEKEDKTRQLGVIAQEVEAVLPEIIHTNGESIKSVDYAKLTALLIEVNKTQQVQIASQQAEIEQLKVQVQGLSQLKAMVEELQVQLNH